MWRARRELSPQLARVTGALRASARPAMSETGGLVVISPAPEDPSDMSQTVEHFFIEAFIAQLAIKAFDEAVLLWVAGRDVGLGNASVVLPFKDGAAGQFGTVV